MVPILNQCAIQFFQKKDPLGHEARKKIFVLKVICLRSIKALDFFPNVSNRGYCLLALLRKMVKNSYLWSKKGYLSHLLLGKIRKKLFLSKRLSTAFTHFVGVQVGSILKSDDWGVANAQLKPGGRAHYI